VDTWLKAEQELTRELTKSLAKTQKELVEQTSALVDARELNTALSDENKDLSFMLDMYKSVLKQLHVPIKLEARKK
jgi:hypothetical protein